MDFQSKNFSYVTDSFQSFMEKAESGSPVYLRALSHSHPTERPTKLDDDFPAIKSDFQLPSELRPVHDELFSSVLRISGRANMWLHYDVSCICQPG